MMTPANLWTRFVAFFLAALITTSATAEGGRALALWLSSDDAPGKSKPLPQYNRKPTAPPALQGGQRNPERLRSFSGDHLQAHREVAEDGSGFHRIQPPFVLAWNGGLLPEVLELEGGGNGTGGGGSQGGEGGLPTGGAGGVANSATGNFMLPMPIVSWESVGMLGVNFQLYHNSCSGRDREFGVGWSHSYDKRVVPVGTNKANLYLGDGAVLPFTESASNPGTFLSDQKGVFDTLTKNSGGTVWTLTTVNQVQLVFDGANLMLSEIRDRYHPNLKVIITRQTSSPYFVTKVTCPSGRELNISYSTGGKADSVTDPMGRTWLFSYYTPPHAALIDHHLHSITFPSLAGQPTASVIFDYNHQDNIVQFTDRRGNDWFLTYQPNEWISSINPPLHGTSNVYIYTYPSTSSMRLTKPGGQQIEHRYNAAHLLAVIIDEASFWTTMQYGSRGELDQVVDGNGNLTEITASAQTGQVLDLTDPSGATWTYTYNSRNDLETIQDPGESQVTTFHYDTATGLLLSVVNEQSTTTAAYTYDSHGQVMTAADALGRTTGYEYNIHGDVIEVTAPSGAIQTVGYGAGLHGNLGRPVSVTKAGSTWTVAYDEWLRVVSMTHPGTPTAQVSVTYDANNNQTRLTNERGHFSTWVYDALNRPTKYTNFRGDEEEYKYNLNSWLIEIENGRGFARTFDYTPRGEVHHFWMPDGYEEYKSFDGNGNVVQFSNGVVPTDYVFDSRDLLTKVIYNLMQETDLIYDVQGRRVAMRDVSGTTTWTYNLLDELSVLESPQGRIEYAYNLAGERTSMTEVGSPNVVTNYNISPTTGQLLGVTKYGQTTNFSYDVHGRLIERMYGNDISEVFTYDARQRLAQVNLIEDSTTHRSQVYSYDVSSNIETHTTTALGLPVTLRTYEYDAQHQLIEEVTQVGLTTTVDRAYAYDGNGNRISRVDAIASSTDVYTYDAGDKLQTITRGGTLWRDYAYDAQGRTTAIAGPGGGYNFNYDDADRIVDLTSPSGTDSFGYNGLNTRVQASWNGSPVQDFLRDGVGVTAPVLRDGDAGYTPGISRHTPLGVVRTHGALKNEHTQWGITGTSPPALTVSAERDYDAFGRTISTGGTWAGPFAYAGGFGYQSSSPDYDFQLLGHRYYDPETGRFLTRDPIKDGRNWWVYCGSNPISGADPSGLKPSLTSIHTKTGLLHYYHELARIASASGMTVWQHVRSTMASGKTVLHHIFPQAQEFHKHWERVFGKEWRKVIDSQLLRMPENYHKLLHAGEGLGRGGWWNKQWRDFFENNKNATPAQVIKEAKRILKEADLGDVKFSDLVGK